jgi:phenylalanyl-tRNA synthetase beta chain
MENLFVNNGFYEIMCNSLCPAGWYEHLTTFPQERLVRLLNPLSSDLNVMRQTLLLGGLEVIAYNMNRQQYDLRLFESGNVYAFDPNRKEDGLKAYRESPRVAIWMTGLAEPQQWRHPASASHFFSLKGSVEKLFAQHGLSMLGMECGAPPQDLFSDGLQYTLNGKVLAYLGVIQKKVLQHFGIKHEVYAAEICWDVLFKALKGQKITYTELPRYPEVRRDLALVLDEEIHYNDLHRLAFRTERHLLKRVTLFDVYRGDKLPTGKKQYALGFVLQDPDKTLTDQAVDAVISKLLNAFQTETNATLR